MTDVINLPSLEDRTKAKIVSHWRRTLVLAGISVPEAELQKALDLLLPGVFAVLAAEAKLKSLGRPVAAA